MTRASLDQMVWRKSSRSGNATAQCVEVAIFSGGVGVRDSKDPAGANLVFGRPEWAAFAETVKLGGFRR